MNMTPKLIGGEWFIEVFTKELGYTLLLENSNLPIAKVFNSYEDAEKYISSHERRL